MALYYSECVRLMESARNPANGKPLQNNTRLYPRGEDFAVQLHSTDVVTIHRDGTYTLGTGGWETLTTRDRIMGYGPGQQIVTNGYGGVPAKIDNWYIRCLPKSSDPEPGFPYIGVTRPFRATDPGAEPVDDYSGCVAGTAEAYVSETTEWIWDERDERQHYAHHALKISDRKHAEVAEVRIIVRGEHEYEWSDEWTAVRFGLKTERWGYRFERAPANVDYKQCLHCKKFRMRHFAWTQALRRWEHYSSECDTYGSFRDWQEAYRADMRRVREGRKLWREWWHRNHMPMPSYIRVNADGYPLRKVSEEHFKAQRSIERHRRRLEREERERIRRQRQVERFAHSIRRRRKPTFVQTANEAAVAIREVRERITTNNESSEERS